MRHGAIGKRHGHFIDSIKAVPKDCDLVLAVLDHDGLHELEFPCRLGESRWIDIRTGRAIEVRPTHWREWTSH
jgi:hypothetical protein